MHSSPHDGPPRHGHYVRRGPAGKRMQLLLAVALVEQGKARVYLHGPGLRDLDA